MQKKHPASYMEADNIDYPTKQADLGLRQYFGNKRSVIINCDNASPDPRVAEVAQQAAAEDSRVIYHRHPENLGSIENFRYAARQSDRAPTDSICTG